MFGTPGKDSLKAGVLPFVQPEPKYSKVELAEQCVGYVGRGAKGSMIVAFPSLCQKFGGIDELYNQERKAEKIFSSLSESL